jgi:hypothetical protein
MENTNEFQQFPKYQVSIVFGEYNFTIRCGDSMELQNALEKVSPLIEKARGSTPKAPEQPTKACSQCNASMTHKSGTSKAGKPWGGWFCSANKEHVEWDK